ncbi:MAG: ankyrin repeat domain-containing protein [Proteobacteria bacterium]|nr:ankyrin repeat domain-containing protein [Pseudomonadota bacterium]
MKNTQNLVKGILETIALRIQRCSKNGIDVEKAFKANFVSLDFACLPGIYNNLSAFYEQLEFDPSFESALSYAKQTCIRAIAKDTIDLYRDADNLIIGNEFHDIIFLMKSVQEKYSLNVPYDMFTTQHLIQLKELFQQTLSNEEVILDGIVNALSDYIEQKMPENIDDASSDTIGLIEHAVKIIGASIHDFYIFNDETGKMECFPNRAERISYLVAKRMEEAGYAKNLIKQGMLVTENASFMYSALKNLADDEKKFIKLNIHKDIIQSTYLSDKTILDDISKYIKDLKKEDLHNDDIAEHIISQFMPNMLEILISKYNFPEFLVKNTEIQKNVIQNPKNPHIFREPEKNLGILKPLFVKNKEEILQFFKHTQSNNTALHIRLLEESIINIDELDKIITNPNLQDYIIYTVQKNYNIALYQILQHKNIKNTDLDKTDTNGKTALMFAASEGHKDIVELLIKKGANLNEQDNYGKTALMKAASEGHEDIVDLLIKGDAALDEKDNYGRTALMDAASKGHEDTVELLIKGDAALDEKDNSHRTALMLAASKGRKDTVDLLIKGDAALDEKDNSHRTALMLAASEGRKDTVELLIKGGANLNERGKFGRTALMYAASEGRKDTVELLIKKGANLNEKDTNGKTALMDAAFWGRKDIVELLIKGGANLNAQDTNGKTTLMNAVSWERKDIVDLLIEKGANLNEKDNSHRTALMLAASEGHKDIVELLIKGGANLNEKDTNDKTALMLAALRGHKDIVDLLIKGGAECSWTDKALNRIHNNIGCSIS